VLENLVIPVEYNEVDIRVLEPADAITPDRGDFVSGFCLDEALMVILIEYQKVLAEPGQRSLVAPEPLHFLPQCTVPY
jgi:hypothetical protein